ncbi:hypothetical protein EMCRGX_G009554 [Ephydatia muelleri]
MSTKERYFASLDASGRQRYLDKLCLLGLSVDNDPYAAINSKNFVSDMSLWPPVEFGHIFCYFIDRPGVYTRQQLLQWKQLNAYYFFTSGMRNPDEAHCSWVATRKTGDIVAAHCTCMAGLGEGCSHVAAILFKIEAAKRNGYTATTSSSCQWNEVFTTKHQPARIRDIMFKRP